MVSDFGVGNARAQPRVWATAIVQVDNATPIILSHDKSVIHGIRGSVVLWLCTRCSSSAGIPCAGAVSRRKRNRRSVEIPSWMFEPATCCGLRLMALPTVGCDALLDLKALLRTVQGRDRGGVLQAEHRSLLWGYAF